VNAPGADREALTTARGTREVSIRRELVLSFTLIIVALAAALLLLAMLDRRQAREELSRTLLDQAQARAHSELRELFAPVKRQLAIDWHEVRIGQVPRYDAAAHVRHFLPPLVELPNVSSMMVADTAGHQLLLMRYDSSVVRSPLLEGLTALPVPSPAGGEFFTRDFRPASRGDLSDWQLWVPTSPAPRAAWEVRLPGYDPTQRAWYVAAMERYARRPRASAPSDPQTAIAWSDAYTLFTTREPGISASFAARAPTGELMIVAYDILLDEVSRYTRAERPTPNGRVFVVSDSGWMIGLPGDERFADRAARGEYTLLPIERLGAAPLDAWAAAWRARGEEVALTQPLAVGDDTWWMGFRAFDLAPGRRFWIGVVAPESDIRARTGLEGTGIVAATVIALLLAFFVAARLARRVADPLAALAEQSARIARLDLAPQPTPTSRLWEVRQLGAAVESMRRALQENLAERERASEALAESKARLLQSQKLDAVGQLAGGVAHDFNNLLTAIRGYATLLRERLAGDAEGLDDLNEIDAAAQRASDLTRQLLAFSRRQHAEPRVLDVNAAVTSATRMLGRLMGEHIKLETMLDDGLPAVRIDPGQLHQVLVNLAVNARDAMPDGGRLTITTSAGGRIRATDAPVAAPYRPPVVISVVDTGMGMTPEVRARVFEPFFTTKETGRGTGLGLATCWGIVRDAHGTIEIESEPGQGTVVRVILPSVSERAVPVAVPGEHPVADGAAATILVVEDEAQLRLLAERTLTRAGLTVLTAADGIAAMELLQKRGAPVDLVLSDVVMPRLGGPGLARRIRAIWPDARMLFTTGYADADAFGTDADAVRGITVLRKPFTPAELVRAVRQELEAPTS
jgi:signal transduction histidine kinase/CheY-like chemotaxis protein